MTTPFRLKPDSPLVLMVGKTKRQPQNDGYVCVISYIRDTFEHGEQVIVCDVTVAKNYKEAKAWFRKQCKSRPWEKEDESKWRTTVEGVMLGSQKLH